MEKIVRASASNMRSTLKSGNAKSIARQDTLLKAAITQTLKAFTGINFSAMQDLVLVGRGEDGAPIKKSEAWLFVLECADFIKERFPMLAVQEIKEAFSLWASKKYDANCTAYGGRLPIGDIGNVLSAYLRFRKSVLGTYSQQLDLLEARSKDAEAEQKNKQAHEHVLKEYRAMVEHFTQTGDLSEIEKHIKAFWGKILVQELGVIEFSQEEKADIVQEAKAFVKKQTLEKAKNPDLPKNEREDVRKMVHYWQKKADLSAFRDKYDPKSIESILKPLEDGFKESSFKDKVVQKYSTLIVLKGIIKESLKEE